MDRQLEVFSTLLIDKELESSKWDLLNIHQVQFEAHAHKGHAGVEKIYK